MVIEHTDSHTLQNRDFGTQVLQKILDKLSTNVAHATVLKHISIQIHQTQILTLLQLPERLLQLSTSIIILVFSEGQLCANLSALPVDRLLFEVKLLNAILEASAFVFCCCPEN